MMRHPMIIVTMWISIVAEPHPGGPPSDTVESYTTNHPAVQDAEGVALAEAQAAIEAGGSPHDIVDNEYGLTRMHVAARAGHAGVLKYLIEAGGEVDVPSEGGAGAAGESPLHWSATGEIVDLLMMHGANLDIRGATGLSPLIAAALRNRPSAVEALVKHGADVNDRGGRYDTPVVMWACTGLAVDYGDPALNRREDRAMIVEFLVSKGADVNATDNGEETALHIAAKYDARFVELLLRLGADRRMEDAAGKTPADWSRELGMNDALALLEGRTLPGSSTPDARLDAARASALALDQNINRWTAFSAIVAMAGFILAAAVAGYVIGRRGWAKHWIPFLIAIACVGAVLIFMATLLFQWMDWRSVDSALRRAIESGTVTHVTDLGNQIEYQVQHDEGVSSRFILRPFDPDFTMHAQVAAVGGILLAFLSTIIRRLSRRRAGRVAPTSSS